MSCFKRICCIIMAHALSPARLGGETDGLDMEVAREDGMESKSGASFSGLDSSVNKLKEFGLIAWYSSQLKSAIFCHLDGFSRCLHFFLLKLDIIYSVALFLTTIIFILNQSIPVSTSSQSSSTASVS